MSYTPPTAAPGYSGTAKMLHWLVVLLLIAQFIFAWTMPHIGRDTPVTTLISLHFTFGIAILAVAAVRLGWRMTHPAPPHTPDIPRWQIGLSHAVHWLLYLLLVVVPLLGWINASWRGMPVMMFGLELPPLVGARAEGWRWTGDVHGLLSNYAMLGLVGLHVAGALYHQVVRRDGVLRRMLPGA
jgi:cytochrome b561